MCQIENKQKLCNQCRTWLNLDCFHRNKNKIDGRQDKCIDCIKDYKKSIKTEKSNIEKSSVIIKDNYHIPNIYIVGFGRTQTYQNCCLSCEKPFFCLQEIRKDVDLFCEFCNFDQNLIQEKNISKINYIGNMIGWICKNESPNKRRIHKNYKKVYIRDKYTCQYCGFNLQNATKFQPLHIDHIKPWSAQGGNSMNNLVVSCQDCNLLVSNKWFITFEEKKEYILFERQKKLFTKKEKP